MAEQKALSGRVISGLLRFFLMGTAKVSVERYVVIDLVLQLGVSLYSMSFILHSSRILF
jgi:hypothetical protein